MDFFEIAAPDVLAEDFGGEIVAINLASGRYYSLRGLACSVWGDLTAGHPTQSVVAAVRDVDRSLAAATEAFVAGLRDEGLIRPRESMDVPGKELESGVVARAGAAAPVLESFDDMADLIQADPIHEVDEDIGWPVRKE